jgi:LEA14-like dessication related protein
MKKSRKIWIWILVFLGILVLFFAVQWYRGQKNEPYPTYIKPRLDMTLVKITKITRGITYMEIKMLISNPLPVGITLDSFSYRFLIGGTEVIKSVYPKTIHIVGGDSGYVSFPVELENQHLSAALKKMEKQKFDSTDYEIRVKSYIALPMLKDKTYEVSMKRRLPVFIIPRVEIRDLDLKTLGLKHTKSVITIGIDNPCAITYRLKSIHYKVNIDTGRLASGTIPGNMIIPAFGQASVDVPVDVNIGKGAETLFDNWFRSSSTVYSVYVDAMIMAEDNFIKDSKVILEAEGKLKEIKALRKQRKE